jgi:hypothetical protein
MTDSITRKQGLAAQVAVHTERSSPLQNRPLLEVEIDKTDPLDKLQHKMNLVSNYFTK